MGEKRFHGAREVALYIDQSRTRTWPVIRNSHSCSFRLIIVFIRFALYFRLFLAGVCCVLNGGRGQKNYLLQHTQSDCKFIFFILFYFIYLLLVLFESSRDHHTRTFYLIYLFYFILFSPSLTANMGVNRLAVFSRWFACHRNFGYSIPIPTV